MTIKDIGVKLLLRYIIVDFNTNQVINIEKSIQKIVLVDNSFNINDNTKIGAVLDEEINNELDYSAYAKTINIQSVYNNKWSGVAEIIADIVMYRENEYNEQNKKVKQFNFANKEG
jgi:hypothetical protein